MTEAYAFIRTTFWLGQTQQHKVKYM